MAQSMMNPATFSPGPSQASDPARSGRRSADSFANDLVALMPYLRAFSHKLCGRQGIAEDMAQEALAKAWSAREKFEPGTNLKAWLFTILRHAYFSHMRRSWREAQWDESLGERIPAPHDEQLWALNLSDCARGLNALPRRQREAVLLVGAGGFSYSAAAEVLDTAVGSVKSRVARGRGRLAGSLSGDVPLPPRVPSAPNATFDDVLAQLSALSPAGATDEPSASQMKAQR